MSDILWAAYFVVGGFYAGPIVYAVFKDLSENQPKDDPNGSGTLMLSLLVGALCWLAWPLAASVKRAMDADKSKPRATPTTDTGGR